MTAAHALSEGAVNGYHTPATLSAANKRRIDYLFDNDLYDLPDDQRPTCHRSGTTYKAVYGRLQWDQPAGTITTGFMTPGRGRYVHPTQRRTLTAHEAARIQGFPDSFRLTLENGTIPPKNLLAKVIGDAVPPPMGYAAVLAAMGLRRVESSDVEAAA
jgi:DNA (cytosine-5)-methyltransferase 1